MKKNNVRSTSGGLESMLDELNAANNRGSKPVSNVGHVDIVVSGLFPSKFQPRKDFNLKEINNLAASIQEVGIINPITIRKIGVDDKYEIITGERRWRAVQMLGWTTIPAIVKDITDKDAQAIALVENLQREDLNPIEEASGYKELLEKHSLTHDQVAAAVGKPRSTISNFIRLLELESDVQELLKNKQIDIGHAKLLVALSKEHQCDLADSVVSKSLSVRQLETLIKRRVFASHSPKRKLVGDDRFSDISIFLKRKLGEDFEVSISKASTNKITFSSEESMLKFMELLV